MADLIPEAVEDMVSLRRTLSLNLRVTDNLKRIVSSLPCPLEATRTSLTTEAAPSRDIRTMDILARRRNTDLLSRVSISNSHSGDKGVACEFELD